MISEKGAKQKNNTNEPIFLQGTPEPLNYNENYTHRDNYQKPNDKRFT